MSNSSKLLQITTNHFQKLYELSNNKPIDYYTKPEDVTREMLLEELSCLDLEYTYNKDTTTDYFWRLYVYSNNFDNHNNSNLKEFGISFLPNEVPLSTPYEDEIGEYQSIIEPENIVKPENIDIPETNPIIATSRRTKSTKNNKGLYNTKKNKWSISRMFGRRDTRKKDMTIQQDIPNKKSGFSYFKKNSRKSRIIRGGTGEFELHKTEYIDSLNNSVSENIILDNIVYYSLFNNILPPWRYSSMAGTFSTLVKLKDIDEITPVFVCGSSLPLPNLHGPNIDLHETQHCSNLLQFYKYIVNVKRLISLQGCDLNWSLLPISYAPNYCEGIHEESIWTQLNQKNGEPPQYNELYWIDMDSGYFNTYEKLSKMDYTRPSNKSLIHCLAGFGRTGTSLLLIICKYYYRLEKNKRNFNNHFSNIIPEYDDETEPIFLKSRDIFLRLKTLLIEHIEINTINDNKIHPFVVNKINKRINEFNHLSISHELFDRFYRSNTNGYIQFKYTGMNLLITRMNYILYFTALANKIENFTLYKIYTRDQFQTLYNLQTLSVNEAPCYLFIYPVNIVLSQFNNEVTAEFSNRYLYDDGKFQNIISRQPLAMVTSPVQPPPQSTATTSPVQPQPQSAIVAPPVQPIKTTPTKRRGGPQPLQSRLRPETKVNTPRPSSRIVHNGVLHEVPEMVPDTGDDIPERPERDERPTIRNKNKDMTSISFG